MYYAINFINPMKMQKYVTWRVDKYEIVKHAYPLSIEWIANSSIKSNKITHDSEWPYIMLNCERPELNTYKCLLTSKGLGWW